MMMMTTMMVIYVINVKNTVYTYVNGFFNIKFDLGTHLPDVIIYSQFHINQ